MPTLLSEVPLIQEHPRSCLVELGNDVTLVCKATGKNLQFRWYKSQTCLSNETAPVLYLRRVSVQDAGRYSCIVSNKKDTQLTWAMVDVVSILCKNRML